MVLNRASLTAAVFATAIASVSFAELMGGGSELRSPIIVFNSPGATTYNADSNSLTIDAAPIAIRFNAARRPRTVDPTGAPAMEGVSIHILVDENGDLIGGVPGDDLIVIGKVDANGDGSPDLFGVLLTGEIRTFGFADPGAPVSKRALTNDSPTDLYNFVFDITGGSLAEMFSDGLIGVALTSKSSTFSGDFVDSFGGLAQGNIGLLGGRCGDGILDPGEECDDGNNVDGDGCSANCTVENTLFCGDGMCTSAIGEDHCTCETDCGPPACGDGVCECGETACNCSTDCPSVCDDGCCGSDEDSCSCKVDCPGSCCGDGILDPGEECDDGNGDDGDGCSACCCLEDDDDSESDPGSDSDTDSESDTGPCGVDSDSDSDDSDDSGDSQECDDCDGKVTVLTLRYNGGIENAHITVDAKRGPSTDRVFDANVNPGEEFTLTGPPTGNDGFAGTLGTEIKIDVNGELNTTIHTSCSQPIGPGLISGDFEAVSGESKNGGHLCPLDGTAVRPQEPRPAPPPHRPSCLATTAVGRWDFCRSCLARL